MNYKLLPILMLLVSMLWGDNGHRIPMGQFINGKYVQTPFNFNNISRAAGRDSVDYSTVPPDSLDTKKIPQLICFGFDDNKFLSGVTWTREMFSKKVNPKGTGNKGTFDGTPARASYYMISHNFYILEPEPWVYDTVIEIFDGDMLKERKLLLKDGHEIGNHTKTHNISSPVMSQADWDYEIFTCSKYLVNLMGVPPMDIAGFRTPYLDYEADTYKSLSKFGFLYDCTLEDGSMSSTSAESHQFSYTLNNGYLFSPTLKYRGLWELPHCSFITGSDKYDVKGFDSGLLPVASNSKGVSAQQYFNILKRTLDKRYNGNRAPMDIGLHSDYYAEENTLKFNSTNEARRKALEDFVDYALSLPDVRIVPMREFITWMRNPVLLDDKKMNPYMTVDSANPSGNLIETSKKITTITDPKSSAKLTNNGTAVVDYTLDATADNFQVKGHVDLNFEFAKSMEKGKAVKITYKSDYPLRLSFPQDGLDSKYSYKKEFIASEEWRTEYVILNNIYVRMPRTVPVSLENTALELNKIKGMVISPLALDSIAKGSFEIKELVCYGAGKIGGNTGINNSSKATIVPQISLVKRESNALYFNLPVKGEYNFSIIDMQGREVANFSSQINQKAWKLPLKTLNLGSGTYFLKMKTKGLKQSFRFISL